MCRNIRTLFNFAPPASDDEIRAASRQRCRHHLPPNRDADGH